MTSLSLYDAEQITKTSHRCTQATMRAFGLDDAIPHYTSGCIEFLKLHGFKLSHMPNMKNKRLEDFRPEHMKAYLILTPGHAMACINRVLVDTEGMGFDDRRIENMWLVEEGS